MMIGKENENRYRSRGRKYTLNTKSIFWLLLTLFLMAFGSYYFIKAQSFKKVFFPNTVINGVDASYKTPQEVKQLIKNQVDSYELAIKSRNNPDEIIKGSEIDLTFSFNDVLDDLLRKQKIYKWYEYFNINRDILIDAFIEMDEIKYINRVEGLLMFDESSFISPQNAYISDYKSGVGYTIEPEILGSIIDKELAKDRIKKAIISLSEQIDFNEENDIYIKPEITGDDPILADRLFQLNKNVSTNVKYSNGTVLDGDLISTWLVKDTDDNVSLNDEEIKNFVLGLSKSYDTVYKPKTLKTSYGKTINITGGNYGWKIDQTAETAQIKELIASGANTQREPVFAKTAASKGENDYGDTYVEVNLTAQKMFYYKNGQLIFDSDFVSGNVSKNYTTPEGVYALTYKQKDATLRGEDYATKVSYWMPFNKGIGFHDAPWRSSFGGNIYKTNGSHGCINLPPDKAKRLFENIGAGIPVLCYYMEGTEAKAVAESSSDNNAGLRAQTNAASTGAPRKNNESKAPDNIAATSAPKVTRPSTDGPNNHTTGEKGPGIIESPIQEIGPGVNLKTE